MAIVIQRRSLEMRCSRLIPLSKFILVSLLTEWLDLKELSLLDISHSNYNDRQYLIRLMSKRTVQSQSMITASPRLLQWIRVRSIQLTRITWNARISLFFLGHEWMPHIQYLRALHVHDTEDYHTILFLPLIPRLSLLTELKLTHCKLLTTEVTDAINLHCKQLTSIDFNAHVYSTNNMCATSLLNMIYQQRNLTSLSLRGFGRLFTSNQLISLMAHLPNLRSLSLLRLVNKWICDLLLSSKSFNYNQQLQQLSVSFIKHSEYKEKIFTLTKNSRNGKKVLVVNEIRYG